MLNEYNRMSALNQFMIMGFVMLLHISLFITFGPTVNLAISINDYKDDTCKVINNGVDDGICESNASSQCYCPWIEFEYNGECRKIFREPCTYKKRTEAINVSNKYHITSEYDCNYYKSDECKGLSLGSKYKKFSYYTQYSVIAFLSMFGIWSALALYYMIANVYTEWR